MTERELLLVARALCDPTRLMIYLGLGTERWAISELAARYRIATSTASYHARALREAKLVRVVADGRWRYIERRANLLIPT